MDALTKEEVDLLYVLVKIELNEVNEGYQIGTKEYAERLESILNKLAIEVKE